MKATSKHEGLFAVKQSLRLFACCAALGLALTACSQAPSGPAAENAVTLAEGDWAIDPKASHLAYVSVKAGEIAEANRFDNVSGSMTAEGVARLEVALASVNTGVDIRDERMREIFFEVAEFPSAVVTAQIDPAKFAALEVGKAMVQPVTAKLVLKGMEADVEARVQVARISEDRVIASTTQPIIITTDMFGLTDELGELRALAQLPSISPAVPVTFTLAFQRTS